MDANRNIEEIEGYLDGSLQGTALQNFQQRLQNEPALAKQVALLKKVDHSLKDEKALEVQKVVMELGDEFFQKTAIPAPTHRLPFYRRPLAIAAGFLLLIALAFLLQQQMSDPLRSNQELYAAYYQPYQAADTNRGEDTQTLYQQALQQYQAKAYPQTIAKLQEVLAVNPDDIPARFYLAHAYLNSTPPALEEASNYFKEIIDDGKSILVPKAQWYLALVYLKQDQSAAAKAVLQSLSNSADGKLAEQAKDLLGQMQ